MIVPLESILSFRETPASGEHRAEQLHRSAPAHCPAGYAVLLVLAVISVTLAISYALSRTSVTTASLSVHECGGLRARSVAETAVTPPFVNLRTNPNWMPENATTNGALASDEHYQVSLEITGNGRGRMLDAAAQIYDNTYASNDRPIADQQLKIQLTKQTRNDLPTGAITAFESNINQSNDPPVYIAAGNTVSGDVRSKGPIHFQQGFQLQGTPRVLGDVSRSGTTAVRYFTYRASWGSTYQAESLVPHGHSQGNGTLRLENKVLGPSNTNPMGVFYYDGDELELEDNVQITGTVAVRGDLKIKGVNIRLIALKQALVPNDPIPVQEVAAVPDTETVPNFLDSFITILEEDVLQNIPFASVPGSVVNTTFPVIVADDDVIIDSRSDVVRISGLIVAGSYFHRRIDNPGLLLCGHNHLQPLSTILDIFSTSNGPAIYVRGSIMCGRAKLEHLAARPFAIEFDPAVTNVSDAPGFFTWRVMDWREANE
jgi:hypothetical protein